MTILNLTPHTINIVDESGAPMAAYEPSGTVARVDVRPGAPAGGYPFPCPVMTSDATVGVVGLPEPADGVFYLVSGFVGAAVSGTRPDVLVPGTGPKDNALRNEKGHIVGVRCLKVA
jgi:hypothetical protein